VRREVLALRDMLKELDARNYEMRAFGFACLMLVGIAVGSAVILLELVQQSASTAFAEPSARI
jgi:hypothetical protein